MVAKSKKVSIIVPIYNVEKYLDRCIESITQQTYNNLEIILVDDESPDKCPEMCEIWAKKDFRIKVIHKKNEGLGYARNTGIENATGDYLCFVDSDDMLDKTTIEETIDSNFDIIYYGFKNIDKDDNITYRRIPTPEKEKYYKPEIISKILPNLITDVPNAKQYNMNMSSCMCLISKKVVDKYNWRFVSERNIISEDVYSLMILFKNINSIKIVNKDFYSYRINQKSLTRSYKDDRYKKVKKLHKELLKLYDNEDIKYRIDYLYLSYTISCLKQIVESNNTLKHKLKLINEIISDKYLKGVCKKNYKKDSKIRKIYLHNIIEGRIKIIYIMTYIQNKRNR